MKWMVLFNKLQTIVIISSIVLFGSVIYGCGSENGFDFLLSDPGGGYAAPHEPYMNDPSIKGVNLNGTLMVEADVICDWDVNDPNAPYQNNDQPENAQFLSAPATVGGFLRWSDNGPDGRFFDSWDVGDYYAVTLSAGDTIEMVKVDQSAEGKLNIELRSAADPEEIIETYSLDEKERITIEEHSDYLIHVTASGGAFNYLLHIGSQADEVQSGQPEELSFVPGEAIVRFKNEALQENSREGLQMLALDNNLLAPESLSSRYFTPQYDRPVLMRFKKDEEKRILSQRLNLADKAAGEPSGTAASIETTAETTAEDTLSIIAALNRQPDVLYAEPNYIRKLKFTPNDEYYHLQWHYPLIALEAAWDITMGSSDVVVAIVDSGVRYDHPDLSSTFTNDGFDFISNPDTSLDGDGIDFDPSDPGDNPEGGSTFHGSHVAGTIAATTDNGKGVAGVAGRTRVMPLRSFGLNGKGTIYDILQALRYAAGMSNASGQTPHRPADIINLSIGGTSYSQSEADLYNEIIHERGIVVVAAAGNESTRTPIYPASYPGVISVSAVDLNAKPTLYSNYGDHIDLAAPGGNTNQDLNEDDWQDGILSTVGVEEYGRIFFQYRFYQGTSMASPHVAGVVALMKSVKPDLTAADVLGWLIQGNLSTDLGPPGWDDRYGYGLINAYKAVLTAQNEPQPEAEIIASPRRLNLGNTLSQASLKLAESGSETFKFVRIDCEAEWVQVAPLNVDDEYLGTYSVRVDRTHGDLAEPGRYDTTLAFVFDRQTITVELSVLVGGPGESLSDGHYIGHLYVLLVDGATNATRYGVPAEYMGNGLYRFEFDNVPSGRYQIVAGSNRDYDDRIGEPGEARSIEPQDVDLNGPTQLDEAIKVDFN